MTVRRILVSAYGCEPAKGSEQGVGWHWCMQLARLADIVVLTRSNNRTAIEAALPVELVDRIRFEYYDLPRAVRRYKRKEKGLYLYYLLWQWGAYRRARQLLRESNFDYSMHLTFGSIWMPTFMHRLPLPFIWGPVGGGEAVPFGLIGTLPVRGRITQYLRYVLMSTVSFNPFLICIIHRARVVLARTEDTARLVPACYSSKVRVVLETAMTDDMLAQSVLPRIDKTNKVLRIIYTGRLVALKNFATVLHAIAHVIDQGIKLRLVIVGDGPLRSSLEALSNRLRITGHIEFRGAVSQTEVFNELRNSDIYLFPSLKEGGVWSLMEAMAFGLPTICINASGMQVITDDLSAIRIEPISQQQMIDEFAKALVRLAQSPSLRRELGNNARCRIEKHFLWHHKGDFMASLFEELEHTTR
jgi:glycosyltransferase involved in cell wall biosynthesis